MTVNTILIPTDGSDGATQAAHRGFDLATQLDAEVHILSVADSSLATGVGYSGDSPRMRRRLREQATERADSLGQEASSRGLDVTTAIREGIPAQEIVEYANEHDLDGIVIGTARRGGVSRAVIGSVADKVIRTATIPVITLNRATLDGEQTAGNIDSLLIPTDGSEPAERAATRGLELADQLDAQIHVLSVVEPTDPVVEAKETNGDEFADEATRKIEQECRDRDLDVITSIRTGKPAVEIVEYVSDNDIGGIVIGTQGHGGFTRWLVGSVTDTVVRTAPVPVITIRATQVPANE